jgi:hypothetical protein
LERVAPASAEPAVAAVPVSGGALEVAASSEAPDSLDRRATPGQAAAPVEPDAAEMVAPGAAERGEAAAPISGDAIEVAASSEAPAPLDPHAAADLAAASVAQKAPETLALASVEPDEAAALVSDDKTEVAAVVAPPRPDALAIDPAQEIETVVTGYGCARINAHYEISGELSISGHLQSAADRANMLAALAAIPGVHDIDHSGVYVVGDPYCRVFSFLDRPDFTLSDKQKQSIKAFGNPSQEGVQEYAPGETLDLTLGSPDVPSYVYVDIFSSNGKVTHLLPAKDVAEARFAGPQSFYVGRRGRGRDAPLGDTPGLKVVTAIGSSELLFPQPRFVLEDATQYLDALGAAVGALKQRGVELHLEYAYWLIYINPQAAAKGPRPRLPSAGETR